MRLRHEGAGDRPLSLRPDSRGIPGVPRCTHSPHRTPQESRALDWGTPQTLTPGTQAHSPPWGGREGEEEESRPWGWSGLPGRPWPPQQLLVCGQAP